MYLEFYGFNENPFSLSPNPRFIFFSKTHKEAFALLLYGINNRFGFIELTGEVGTGKTTVLRTLLSQLDEEKYRTALIFNPALTAIDLMRAINHEFGIPCESENIAELLGELNAFLLQENCCGRTVVLIIDEAQNLPPALLEQVRLISNFETDTDKLIQIVLAGQPELGRILEKPELRQINQRIALRYNLHSLDQEDSRAYIKHRITTAGGGDKVSFAPGALGWLYRYSRGTPRLINILCDRALLIAYTEDRRKITCRTVALAFRDVMLKPALRFLPTLRKGAAAALMITLLAMGAYLYKTHEKAPTAVKSAAETTAKPVAAITEKPAVAPPAKPLPAPVTAKPVVAPATAKLAVAPIAPKPAVAHEMAKPVVAMVLPKPLASHEILKPGVAPAKEKLVAEPPIIQIEDKKVVAELPGRAIEQPVLPFSKQALANELSLRSEAKNAVQAFNAVSSFWQVPPVVQMNERPPMINQIKGQAEKRHLEMAHFKGKMDDLLRLDSPALLALSPKGTKGSYLVALTGVRDGKLQISPSLLGRNTFSKAEIAPLWSGQAYIPWRNGERIPSTLAKGAAGPDVIRLQVLLQTAGLHSVEVNGMYDEKTVKTIKDFQASRKISATGKVNPITLIQLYKAVNGASAPSLAKQGKGGGE
jgi:type II secretory pathway predicted ATPase ExeA